MVYSWLSWYARIGEFMPGPAQWFDGTGLSPALITSFLRAVEASGAPDGERPLIISGSTHGSDQA